MIVRSAAIAEMGGEALLRQARSMRLLRPLPVVASTPMGYGAGEAKE